MDPDAALADIRHLLHAQYRGEDVAYDLAVAIDALDTWVTRGGALPAAWNAHRSPAEDPGTPSTIRPEPGTLAWATWADHSPAEIEAMRASADF